MKGVYYNRLEDKGKDDLTVDVLAQNAGFELARQKVIPRTPIWVEPAQDPSMFEILVVLSGRLTALDPSGQLTLGVGDSLYVCGLEETLQLRAETETELLYIANRPVMEDLLDFQTSLHDLMHRIDDKDHYTYHHCRNVMYYSVELMREMGFGSAAIDKMGVASMFHDVGKCSLSDSILKNHEQLSEQDILQVMKHPINSRRLLEPQFGKEVANIAESHHERLDGTGYPYHLTAAEITPEARIIAVADTFDAMTTDRGYNRSKGFIESVAELEGMTEKFDAEVIAVLRKLIESGKIRKTEQESEL